MTFYLKLAWRNIFRNRRRTIIAAVAIGIGLASLIFMDALLIGMKDNLIHSVTASFMGEAQIHRRDFRKTSEPEKTIHNHRQLLMQLQQDPRVDRFSTRAMAMGMITSAADASAVMLVGINPGQEKFMSQFDDYLREGEFFSEDNPRDIVIGSKLAETLEVTPGDRVVLTASKIKSGELAQEMFRISGIYHFNINELDRGMVLIRLPRAQQLLNLGEGIHEIALKFKDISMASRPELDFWEKYSGTENEAAGWPVIMPQMKQILDLTEMSLVILALILAVVVVFGIINTLFMSLYERMFEFGVLRAVGTRSGGIRRLILFEALCLGIISAVIGIVLGFVLTWIVSQTGIDYRGIEISGAHFKELLYPVLQWHQFIKFPLWVILFTFLVGLYPARVAARMKIASSLRKSL